MSKNTQIIEIFQRSAMEVDSIHNMSSMCNSIDTQQDCNILSNFLLCAKTKRQRRTKLDMVVARV